MASHLSLKRLFNSFNRKFFDGQLPADTQIIWAPLDGAHGKCWPGERVIHIDPPLQAHVDYLRIIMLHEMAHLKHPRAGHGKKFQEEIQRLHSIGAYKGLL